MPKYNVVKPCQFVQGGRAWEVGAVVDVDGSRAEVLVNAGVLKPIAEASAQAPLTESAARKRKPEIDDEQ